MLLLDNLLFEAAVEVGDWILVVPFFLEHQVALCLITHTCHYCPHLEGLKSLKSNVLFKHFVIGCLRQHYFYVILLVGLTGLADFVEQQLVRT